MSRSTRDVSYRIFIIIHILPSILLAIPGVLSNHILPPWSQKPLQLYLSTYNDPLAGGKSFPGGWFGGFSACEVLLQLPYFLWALTIPIGIHCFVSQLKKGDKRLELPSLAYSVHASTAVLACVCELFAYPETVLTWSEKVTLGAMYIPFQILLGLMAIDMYKRIRIRLEAVKQE